MSKDQKKELEIFCDVMNINIDNPNYSQRKYIEYFDIFSLMINSNEKYSIDDLLEVYGYDVNNYESSGLNAQKLYAMFRTLVDQGYVIRTEKDHKAYFEISNKFKTKYHIVEEQKNLPSANKIIEDSRVEYYVDDIDFDVEKMDNKLLIKYVQHIAKLETNLYIFKERYTQLLQKNIKARLSLCEAINDADKILQAKIKCIEEEIESLKSKIDSKPVLGHDLTVSRPNAPEKPIFSMEYPNEPIYIKPTFFNKKKVELQNAELKNNYLSSVKIYEDAKNNFEESMKVFELKMADYNKKIEECNIKETRLNQESYEKQVVEYSKNLEKWQSSLEEKNKYLSSIQDNIDKEKEQLLIDLPGYQLNKQIEYELDYLTKKIKKTVEVQNKLYSYGIVYGKYRNYVAISSFCDYLMSGRCYKLDGPEGAYNLYEQESRADIVICKLDTIISSLEKIQENQYFIYNELKTANASLELINAQLLMNNVLQAAQLEKLDEIIENTAQTALNTQVGAFYAKKNKELTDALGFMMAL